MPTKAAIKSMKGGYKITSTTKATPTAKPTLHKGGSSSVKPLKGGSSSVKPQKGGSSCAKPQNGGSKKTKKNAKKTKKTKKSKKPMPKGFAYCMNPKCRKQVKMLTEKSKTTKNGRTLLYGEGACGHTVYRFA